MQNVKKKQAKYFQNPSSKKDLFMISCIIGIVLVIYRSAFVHGEPFLPGYDCNFLDYPMRLLAWESVRAGEWPLWNPYNSGGINLLGSNPFFYLLYPVTAATYLFQQKETVLYLFSIISVFHVLLAIVGMYLFLSKLVVNDKIIAFWGSILYGFSYPVVDSFKISIILSANYAYVPWLLLSISTMEKRGAMLNIVVIALIIFVMLGGGALQWNVFIFFIAFLFLLFRYNPFQKSDRSIYCKGLWIFIVSVLGAFLLGSIELVPFLEQNINGGRTNVSLIQNYTQQNWQPPWFLSLRLFVPNVFNMNLFNFVNNPMIFLEDNFNSYFGVVPALLMVMGMFTIKNDFIRSWKIVLIILFFIALGNPFLTKAVFYLSLRGDLVYVRIASLIPIIGVLMATKVLEDALIDKKIVYRMLITLVSGMLFLLFIMVFFQLKGKTVFGSDIDITYIHYQVITGIVFIFLFLVLYFFFTKKIIGKNTFLILLCVVSLVEMKFTSLRNISPNLETRPVKEYFEKTESEKVLDDLLGTHKDMYRVHNTSVRFGEITHYLGGPYMHYFPNANIFNHFYEANGYILNMQKDMGQLLTNAEGQYFIRMADLLTYNSLPRLLSIKYIIAEKDFDPYHTTPAHYSLNPKIPSRVAQEFTEKTPQKDFHFKIIQLENIPPKYFFTKRIILGQKREQLFGAVIDKDFDPRERTYFEDTIEGMAIDTKFDVSGQKVTAVEALTPNKVIVHVTAKSPGIFVANNFWHKWWKVSVNGKEQKIYRVNYLFQALRIPEGSSTLYFYTESASLKLGMALSLLGIIIIIILVILSFKNLRKNHNIKTN